VTSISLFSPDGLGKRGWRRFGWEQDTLQRASRAFTTQSLQLCISKMGGQAGYFSVIRGGMDVRMCF
jgi:hypothetical protein